MSQHLVDSYPSIAFMSGPLSSTGCN